MYKHYSLFIDATATTADYQWKSLAAKAAYSSLI